MLELQNLSRSFRGIPAIQDVSFKLAPEIRIPFSDLPPSIASQLSLEGAGHITRATASIICFRCDSSTRSCFLPFSVSR